MTAMRKAVYDRVNAIASYLDAWADGGIGSIDPNYGIDPTQTGLGYGVGMLLDGLAQQHGAIPATATAWAAQIVDGWEQNRGGATGALVLDGGAITALSHGPTDARDRVRALIVVAGERDHTVVTTGSALTEVGRSHPEEVRKFLDMWAAPAFEELDANVALRAGALLVEAGLGPELSAEACLVAYADRFGGGVVVTDRASALEPFAALLSDVAVAGIS